MEQPFSQNCHLLKLEVDIIEKIIARNRNQHHTTDVFVLFRKVFWLHLFKLLWLFLVSDLSRNRSLPTFIDVRS